MELDMHRRESVPENPEDQPRRSIAKSLTWRALATLTTFVIVFAYTGELALSLGVGAFDVVIKLSLYYLHERFWMRIRWGRTVPGATHGLAPAMSEKTLLAPGGHD